MKISSERRKEILLETFETLKNNYNDNSIALQDLIGKMSKIDLSIAIEMWKNLVNNNIDVLHSTHDFAFSIMYNIQEAIGEAKMYRIVAEDNFLKNVIFKECGDLRLSPIYMIRYYIKKNELSLANELMELIFSNKRKENSIFDILEEVIPEDENISEEAYELLNEWIDRVKSKEEKAKLNLKMLSFTEEE